MRYRTLQHKELKPKFSGEINKHISDGILYRIYHISTL